MIASVPVRLPAIVSGLVMVLLIAVACGNEPRNADGPLAARVEAVTAPVSIANLEEVGAGFQLPDQWVLSSDGAFVVFRAQGPEDATTQIYSQRLLPSSPAVRLTDGTTMQWTFALTPDSKTVLFDAGDAISARAIDGSSSPLALAPRPPGDVMGIGVSNDAASLVLTVGSYATGNPSTFKFSLKGDQPPVVLAAGLASVPDRSPGGTYLLTYAMDGRGYVAVDIASGDTLWTGDLQTNPSFGPTDEYLVVNRYFGSVYGYALDDLQTGAEVRLDPPRPDRGSAGFTSGPKTGNSQFMIAGWLSIPYLATDWTNEAIVLPVDGGAPITVAAFSSSTFSQQVVSDVNMSSDGSWLIVTVERQVWGDYDWGTGMGTVGVDYYGVRFSPLGQPVLLGTTDGAGEVAFAPSSEYAILPNCTLVRRDFSTATLPGCGSGARFSPNSKYFTLFNDVSVQRWRVDELTSSSSFSGGAQQYPRSATVTNKGTVVFSTQDWATGKMRLWIARNCPDDADCDGIADAIDHAHLPELPSSSVPAGALDQRTVPSFSFADDTAAATPVTSGEVFDKAYVARKAPFIAAAAGKFDAVRTPAIDTIVMHQCGGFSFSQCFHTLAVSSDLKSAHYLVSKTGKILQLVDEAAIAYHASYANGWSVGIESEDGPGNVIASRSLLTAAAALSDSIAGRSVVPIAFPEGQATPADAVCLAHADGHSAADIRDPAECLLPDPAPDGGGCDAVNFQGFHCFLEHGIVKHSQINPGAGVFDCSQPTQSCPAPKRNAYAARSDPEPGKFDWNTFSRITNYLGAPRDGALPVGVLLDAPSVSVTDLPAPRGVRLEAANDGTGRALIIPHCSAQMTNPNGGVETTPYGIIYLSANSVAEMTCGSLEVVLVAGTAQVVTETGMPIDLTAGAAVKLSTDDGGNLSVTNTGTTGSVTLRTPDGGVTLPGGAGYVLGRCGNGQLDVGEECDDGNDSDGDACSNACRSNDRAPVAKCKDVSVAADASCRAMVSVDAGSFDPDGDSLSCSASAPAALPPGKVSVVLTCSDGRGLASSCTAVAEVTDQTAPAITCAPIQTLECANQQGIVPAAPTVTDNCTSAPSMNCTPKPGATLPFGATDGKCTAKDAAGNTASCATRFVVQDSKPPSVVVRAATSLWPPNLKFTTFTPHDFLTSASDACVGRLDVDAASTFALVRVLEDGKLLEECRPGKSTCRDVQITDRSIAVRSTRSDSAKAGRTYAVSLNVADGHGNTSTAEAQVLVPHDQRASGCGDR